MGEGGELVAKNRPGNFCNPLEQFKQIAHIFLHSPVFHRNLVKIRLVLPIGHFSPRRDLDPIA